MNKTTVKILIADDEEILLRKLSSIMEAEGFTVIQARNGNEAIKIAQRSYPDIIILDLLMPFNDGFKTLQKLRSYDWCKEVPIIILTNLKATDKLLQPLLKEKLLFYIDKSNMRIQLVTDLIKKILSD